MTWETSNRKSRLPSNWFSLRKRVLARDSHKCRLCGAKATEVDHIIRGDNHDMSNLQSLCADCHKAKSSSEGVSERQRKRMLRQRPKEQHPGLRKPR